MSGVALRGSKVAIEAGDGGVVVAGMVLVRLIGALRQWDALAEGWVSLVGMGATAA